MARSIAAKTRHVKADSSLKSHGKSAKNDTTSNQNRKRRGEHTVGATKQKEAEEPDFAKYSPGTLIETMDVIGKALERICFESHASISVLLVIASDDECKTRIHFCEPHISKMALAANEEIHEASMGFEELRSLEETANNKPI